MNLGKIIKLDIDTFRVRLFVILLAWTIVTAFFVVPRANGVDGTVQGQIQNGLFCNIIVVESIYTLRVKIFGQWTDLRKLIIGLSFELFIYELICLSIYFFFKQSFSLTNFYLNLPFIIILVCASIAALRNLMVSAPHQPETQ